MAQEIVNRPLKKTDLLETEVGDLTKLPGWEENSVGLKEGWL